MERSLANLPEEKDALQAMVYALMEERDREQRRAENLYVENLRLQVEVERFRKWYYGARADRMDSPGELAQALLKFAEELEQKPVQLGDVPPDNKEPEYELRRVKRRKGRRDLANFEHLPMRTVVQELSPEQRACPCCGEERTEIGEDERWLLEHIPARFERIRHVSKKYACGRCESQGENPQIERAAKAETVIEKGLAGPGLLAYIVTSKFADYLPLYRLEDIFQRQGFEISRATQSIWCGDVANLVEPLYELMARRVRESHVVATDDTIMPMQSVGKAAQARMWVYVGDADHPYNLFHFTLDRGRDGPNHFLKDYKQVLLADAYGGYNGVVAGNEITRAGCWAHVRRRLIEAEKTAPEMARDAVALVRALYAVEKEAKDASVEERLRLRQKHSVPVLDQLREKFLTWKEQLLPKHPMAEAVNYALNQWTTLKVFCSDGAVPIDNNVSEREMKRVVLNRKNSLFVGNERGGRTAAILASLTSTCRRHDVDPQVYLTQLLMNLPQVLLSELPAWLPDQWKLQQAARTAQFQTTTPSVS